MGERGDGTVSGLYERIHGTAPDAAARDWAREHSETMGKHYGLTGEGSSAWAHCPRCPKSPFTRRALAGQLPAKDITRG